MKENKGIVATALEVVGEMVETIEAHKEVVKVLPLDKLASVIEQLEQEYKFCRFEIKKLQRMITSEIYHKDEADGVSKLRLRYLKAQESFIETLLSLARQSHNARFLN